MNDEGLITSPSSSGRPSDSHFIKSHGSDRLIGDDRMPKSSKRDDECVANSRKLHKQNAVLGSYDGSIDLYIFLSK